MRKLVADTSALVSLGFVTGNDPDPFAMLLDEFEVQVPERVVMELREIEAIEDMHGGAAQAVLGRLEEFSVEKMQIDEDFPLDPGEHAAVKLANEQEAAFLLCDEFNNIGLIHASLVDTRLVTTPTLLAYFVRHGQLTPDEGMRLLAIVTEGRSWGTNSYVRRAKSLFESD